MSVANRIDQFLSAPESVLTLKLIDAVRYAHHILRAQFQIGDGASRWRLDAGTAEVAATSGNQSVGY